MVTFPGIGQIQLDRKPIPMGLHLRKKSIPNAVECDVLVWAHGVQHLLPAGKNILGSGVDSEVAV